jgi:hypothetical protein
VKFRDGTYRTERAFFYNLLQINNKISHINFIRIFSEILGAYTFIYYKLQYNHFFNINRRKEQEEFRRLKYLQCHKFGYLLCCDIRTTMYEDARCYKSKDHKIKKGISRKSSL